MSYRLHKQSPSPPSRGRYWWLATIAAIYSGLIYLNALHNPYVYDDNRTVLNNASIEDITNVRHIVFREMTRPVVNFTYALDRAIWPSQPIGHHTTSVLLHVVNVLLLFRLAWLATLDRRAHEHTIERALDGVEIYRIAKHILDVISSEPRFRGINQRLREIESRHRPEV